MSKKAQEGYRVPEWTITDRLRKARELAGLSQRELAEAIDVSLRTVSNYENPAYDKERRRLILKAWALATGQDYQWIATGEIDLRGDDGGPDGHPSPLTGRGRGRRTQGKASTEWYASGPIPMIRPAHHADVAA